MADLLLPALLKIVMQKATDSLVQQIAGIWGVDDQRERLKDMLLAVEAVLADAATQGASNPAVKNWMLKLKSAAYDADDVLDEFCYEELHRDAVNRGHKVGNDVSDFLSLNNPALFRYKMSRKLKKVVGRIEQIVADMGTFRFDQSRREQVVDRVKTDSLLVESNIVGRDSDKEKLVKLLLEGYDSADLMVVPVVGMGGLGKTTLAQLIYNDPRVKEHFKLPLWVCVSEKFNIGELVKSIIELVKGDCNVSVDNIELLQRRLREVVGGKRYILVLDDVWNENEDAWSQLKALLNCGDSGSAIIVTTRSGRVASIMGTVESYNLGCLGDDDSWNLFQKRAFSKGVKERQELTEMGRKMVRNCRGLPLAIKTLGALMSYKHEVEEWRAVLQKSNTWAQRPASEVLPVLKLSYDHLPPFMKQCFAFCAVFPKDYEMDKENLIEYWMANGFIPSDGSGSLNIIGNEIFNELAWRSFFHEVRQVRPRASEYWRNDFSSALNEGYCSQIKCKMHDLMHDLAQSIMGGECCSTSEVHPQYNYQPKPNTPIRHLSVKIIPLDLDEVMHCFPHIRSLIQMRPPYGRDKVKEIGFVKSNSLRILKLVVHRVAKTMVTPENMKHLRYLEIYDIYIKSLPETISTLYLLQTLKLSWCRDLENLPEDVQYMSNLRHLYIEGCYNLRSMPASLSQLNLRILTTYIVGTDASNGIRELDNMNELHGKLHLYNLRNIGLVVDAREANLKAKHNLDNLTLCWGKPHDYQNFLKEITELNSLEEMHVDPFEVLNALEPCNKLKVLEITLYRGDKFPVWMMEYQMLENLIELYIIECWECTKIPPLEKLPFLRVLKLKRLDKLRHLCNSESTSAQGGDHARITFPSLKSMVLYEMPNLCSWYESEIGNKSSTLIFPELKTLELTNCPKLIAMPNVPSLTSLSITGNKNLSRFATGLTTLHDLSLRSQDKNEALSIQPWESLDQLFLEDYNYIVPAYKKEWQAGVTPTKCRSLSLWSVSNIPSDASLWFWKCFIFLETLQIHRCKSFIYWPEKEMKCLHNLREISVFQCPNFQGLQVGRSSTEVLLPKLQFLHLSKCPKLVEIPKCSTSITSLYVMSCPKLQCLPEWLGSLTAIKLLWISGCNSLNALPLSIGALNSLETLRIENCTNLTDFPEGMDGLKALKELKIENCPKISVLPDGLLQQLKNLDEIWIEDCPLLERHFHKYGKYRHRIHDNRFTKMLDGRRSGMFGKFKYVSVPLYKFTCISEQS